MDKPINEMHPSSPEFCRTIARDPNVRRQRRASGDKLTFVILGGRDHADDYYGGQTFAVEMDLATALRDHLRLQGLDITVIYSPHPANQPFESCFSPMARK